MCFRSLSHCVPTPAPKTHRRLSCSGLCTWTRMSSVDPALYLKQNALFSLTRSQKTLLKRCSHCLLCPKAQSAGPLGRRHQGLCSCLPASLPSKSDTGLLCISFAPLLRLFTSSLQFLIKFVLLKISVQRKLLSLMIYYKVATCVGSTYVKTKQKQKLKNKEKPLPSPKPPTP